MRDIDNFNSLEERACALTGQLEEGTYKSQKTVAQQAAAQQAASADGTLESKSLPEKCKLCRTGKREIFCEVCILDDYL